MSKAKTKTLEPHEAIKIYQKIIRELIRRSDDLESAIAGVTDQFEPEVSRLSAAASKAEKILKGEF